MGIFDDIRTLGGAAIGTAFDAARVARDALRKAADDVRDDGADDDEDGNSKPPTNGAEGKSPTTKTPKGAAPPPGKDNGDPAKSGGEADNPESPLLQHIRGSDKGPAQEIAEAAKNWTLERIEDALDDPKSIMWDPFAITSALGYKDKASMLPFVAMNQMVWRMPILQAIVKHRVGQVSNFARPAKDKFSIGYRVKLRDDKQKPTPASDAQARYYEQWISTTGATPDPRARDSFETFLKKYTLDSMKYDARAFEVVPSRRGKPAEFYCVDATTIRIADSTKLRIPDSDTKTTRYVQVYEDNITSEYELGSLCYGIRNPNPDIRLQGYGTSEVEMLIMVVTALLYGWDYNTKFFSQGVSQKGVLNIKGNISPKQLRQFRRHWYSMVAGIENAFRTPIINADEIQWMNMQSSNRDMEFSAWMDFLIKIAAAVSDMDPMEINFKYGDSGAAGPATFESGTQERREASKDKGLKPLLRGIASDLDAFLIKPLDEDFEFEFVGLEAQTANETADLNTKLVKTIKTVDEVRAEEGLAPMPEGLGAIILDPVFQAHAQAAAQMQQQKEQAEQQAEMMKQQGGDPDDPFGPDGSGFGGGEEGDDGDTKGFFDAKPGTGGPPKPAKPAGPPGAGGSPFAKSQTAPVRRGRVQRPVPGSTFRVDVEV